MIVANFKEPCPLSNALKVACLIHHYNIVGEIVTLSLIKANFADYDDDWMNTLIEWNIIDIFYNEVVNGRAYKISKEAKLAIDDFYTRWFVVL
jgi:hypothetical protein